MKYIKTQTQQKKSNNRHQGSGTKVNWGRRQDRSNGTEMIRK